MLLKFIDGQLSKLDCKLENNPGKVTIRRLNKEEYRNTIRDLLHVDFQPDDFPNDEVGYGFDNIARCALVAPATHGEIHERRRGDRRQSDRHRASV